MDKPVIIVQSLTDKLKTEERICLECGLRIESPFIERCPRCFSHLPAIDVDCEGCIHKILCPIGKNRKLKS